LNKKILEIFVITILLLNMVTVLSMAQISPKPHAADAMWVEPSSVTFTASNATVDQKFNMTVWLNMTESIFSYQVGMHYNSTLLMCTRAKYTAGTSSQYVSGHTTVSPAPAIDTSIPGNGKLLAFETCYAGDNVTGPNSGSLIWAEFQILTVPSSGSYTAKFDITTEYLPAGVGDEWITDASGSNYLAFTTYDGTYSIIGAGPPPLSVTITPPAATVYVGQSVPFGSTVNGGIPPYTYQWFLNGSPAPGGTSNTWTFTPATNGSYTVSLNVTDNNGTTAESNVASVTVMPPPGETRIYVDPAEIGNLTMGPSSTFYINITIANATDLEICDFNLTYDSSVLRWIGIDISKVQDQYPTASIMLDNNAGFVWVSLNYSIPINANVPTQIVRMHFHVEAYGATVLDLQDTQLLDSEGHPITHQQLDGLFINIIRDVAVTNVVPSTNFIYQGWIDNINITVKNLGNITEIFNASAYYNSTLIAIVPIVNLAPGNEITGTIPWNTTGVPEGNYTIEGVASTVPFETNTTNNIYVDGTVQVTTITHDVAITNVTTTRNWVYKGNPVNITVTAKNLGNVSESFNVSAYADSNLIGTIPLNDLASGAEVALTFQWNTSSALLYHNYTMIGTASIVPFEYNTANNIYNASGTVTVRFVGDINGDGKVDGKDITIVSLAFASHGPDGFMHRYPGQPASPNWNPDADINFDNVVDGKDIVLVAINFGHSYP